MGRSSRSTVEIAVDTHQSATMTVLRSGSASHVGRVRTVNEDLAFEGSTLFAVADGMGGHAGGEVAARTAIDSLRSAFEHSGSAEGLVEAVQKANQAVWEKGHEDPKLRGMGTTLIVAALVRTDDGDRLVIANVGDSRAYRFHAEEFGQLTIDHSVAEELVARGELSEREAAVHPHRHILTRALGVDRAVDVDIWELVPEQGDRFLLCSDGLSNEVGLDEIGRVLAATRDPQEAADSLVDLANRHGGNDNITAVVLDVLVGEDGAEDESAAPEATPEGLARGSEEAPEEGAARALAADAPAVDESEVDQPAVHQPAIHQPAPPRRTATRRVTFRLLVFLLILGGLGYGAWAAVRWYVDNSYFVGLRHGEVVIYQGRRGGFLGVDPRVVATTGITLSEVSASDLGKVEVVPELQSGVEEPSRSKAIEFVCNIQNVVPGTPAPRGVRCSSGAAAA